MKKRVLFLSYITIGVLAFLLLNCEGESPALIEKPVVSFSSSALEALVEDTVYFTNISKNAISYYWDFGDGTDSKEMHPTHIFHNPGIFSITLIAYSAGDSDTLSQSIQIHSFPFPEFSVDKKIITEGEYITCLNQSVGYNSFSWDFGDGTISSEHQPKHYYSSEGNYKIKLTVLDNGVEVSCEKEIKVLTPNNRWMYFVNENIENIDSVYADKSYLLTMNGGVHSNKTKIKEYYSSTMFEIESLSSVTTIHEKYEAINSSVKYEIGSYLTSDNTKYNHLIIWRKINGVFFRKLELSAQSDNQTMDVEFLEQRRIDWVNRSNNHNANAMVLDLYTDNAIYYSQSGEKLCVGNSQIAVEYQYMNDASFFVESLTPIYCVPVNENTVFEIGKWKVPNASGDYILVWAKCSDGIWRILLDSNY